MMISKWKKPFGLHGLYKIKIHPWRQSTGKTVDSDLRIHCYFVLARSGTIYGFNHETACLIFYGSAIMTMKLRFSISNLGTSSHILCILCRRKNSITIDSFVNPNIRASYIQIYESIKFRFFSSTDISALSLSSLKLPLSSSSTTSRELLSQFSTCSGWRWFEVVQNLKKIPMYMMY